MIRLSRFARTLPLAILLAACSESTAPAEFDETTADIADLAAEAAIADLEILSGIVGAGPSSAPGEPRTGNGGVTTERTRTLAFYDASGAEMDRYDPLLTDRIERSSSLTREVSGTRVSSTQESERSLVVSGLVGEEVTRTFDGSGSDHADRAVITADDATRSWAMDNTVEIRSVVRAVDRIAQPWPLSGSIAREVTLSRTTGADGSLTRTRSTLITFDGTQYATLVVNGETFVVDLSQPRGSAASTSRQDHRGR